MSSLVSGMTPLSPRSYPVAAVLAAQEHHMAARNDSDASLYGHTRTTPHAAAAAPFVPPAHRNPYAGASPAAYSLASPALETSPPRPAQFLQRGHSSTDRDRIDHRDRDHRGAVSAVGDAYHHYASDANQYAASPGRGSGSGDFGRRSDGGNSGGLQVLSPYDPQARSRSLTDTRPATAAATARPRSPVAAHRPLWDTNNTSKSFPRPDARPTSGSAVVDRAASAMAGMHRPALAAMHGPPVAATFEPVPIFPMDGPGAAAHDANTSGLPHPAVGHYPPPEALHAAAMSLRRQEDQLEEREAQLQRREEALLKREQAVRQIVLEALDVNQVGNALSTAAAGSGSSSRLAQAVAALGGGTDGGDGLSSGGPGLEEQAQLFRDEFRRQREQLRQLYEELNFRERELEAVALGVKKYEHRLRMRETELEARERSLVTEEDSMVGDARRHASTIAQSSEAMRRKLEALEVHEDALEGIVKDLDAREQVLKGREAEAQRRLHSALEAEDHAVRTVEKSRALELQAKELAIAAERLRLREETLWTSVTGIVTAATERETKAAEEAALLRDELTRSTSTGHAPNASSSALTFADARRTTPDSSELLRALRGIQREVQEARAANSGLFDTTATAFLSNVETSALPAAFSSGPSYGAEESAAHRFGADPYMSAGQPYGARLADIDAFVQSLRRDLNGHNNSSNSDHRSLPGSQRLQSSRSSPVVVSPSR